MSPNTQKIAEMVELLSEHEQDIIYELVRRLLPATEPQDGKSCSQIEAMRRFCEENSKCSEPLPEFERAQLHREADL